MTKINKEVIGKPRETRRTTGLDYSSGAATAVVVVLMASNFWFQYR